MTCAYYNEHDPFAAAWLRNLIAAGHIAPGEVDERDIRDVTPDDIRSFRQVHLFAGIGIWSAALRGAGWPDDRPVWTASCPCQPFSAAGGRAGFADERHLWPAVHHLARVLRPPVLLGEQVASKDGLAWLDLVSADMEAARYTGGALDLCSAGFGAPNIRQRLYFVWLADADGEGGRAGLCGGEPGALGFNALASGRRDGGLAYSNGRNPSAEGLQRGGKHGQLAPDGGSGERMGDTDDAGSQGRERVLECAAERVAGAAGLGGRVDDAHCLGKGSLGRVLEGSRAERAGGADRPGPLNGFWRAADWLGCRDGKWRPVEAGTFPLASGDTARVGRLRAYGNALNKEVAQGFVEAVMQCAA